MRKISRNTTLEICVPAHVWGICLAEKTASAASSVVVERRAVPEGLLDIGRCNQCGAVVEVLHDLRERKHWDGVGVRADARGQDQADARGQNEEFLKHWAARHHECSSPIPEPPSELTSVRNDLVDQAARAVKKGEVSPATARIVLDTPGPGSRLVALPYGDPPFRDRIEKRERIEKMKALARDFLRQSDAEVLGAVAVCEAWYGPEEEAGAALELPSEQNGAQEGVVAEVRTPRGTHLSVSPIERASGVPGAGHGKLVKPEIAGTPGHSRMLDGLLASDASRSL